MRQFYSVKDYQINDYDKQRKFEKFNEGKFNTLFLGTSLTETGINPKIFDSINPLNRSFNLGISAIPTLEYLKFSEYVIKNCNINKDKKVVKIENILFELRSPIHIRGYDIYERRQSIQSKDLPLVWNILVKQTRIPIYRRVVIFSSYFFSYVLNTFNVGSISGLLQEKTLMHECSDQGYYNPNSNLDSLIKFEVPKNNVDKIYKGLDLLYVKKLNHIIRIAQNKGIKIIFWIPPNLPDWETRDIYTFKDYLIGINFIDGNLNYSLKDKIIWIDKPHLNLYGSSLNTAYLARMFTELNN